MRASSRLMALTIVLSAFAPVPALATHDFTETNDDVACAAPPCPIADNLHINREVPLTAAAALFVRHPLTTFRDDPLPIANAGDIEMLWDNAGFGASSSLALTPNDGPGNYNFLGVTLQTDFAMEGDLEAAMADAGVVHRHQGPDFISARKFYCAYGQVRVVAGILQVHFRISKWIAFGFEDLDSGALLTADYPFERGENFRIVFEVSEPVDGLSTLTAGFYRLTLVDGVLTPVLLESLEGTDNDLEIGQIGLYASAGSFATQIAFDDGIAVVSPISTPTERSTWGRVKALYR